MRSRKGQSTLEYLILVAAIIVATLVFLGNNGVFRRVFSNVYNVNINSMLKAGEAILN
ncbi:MAG: class III signal peptide-containing protein [Candidatus Omnitrophica bacterium]|nr:class III signal peptide-containing protein [Candidatus Omnitrophota bacterium]